MSLPACILQEREEATSFFKTAKGKELRKTVAAQRKTKLDEDEEELIAAAGEQVSKTPSSNGFRAKGQCKLCFSIQYE